MRLNLSLLIFIGLPFLQACAISHPCSEGGDVTWPNAIKGDKKCRQVKSAEGQYLNDGKFQWFYMNGKLAIDGEFKNGLKDGVWTQYDEKSGRVIMEKNFEKGREILLPGAKDPDDDVARRKTGSSSR